MEIGDRVKYNAYTDCFEVHHEEIPEMVITRKYLVKCDYMADYFRIFAHNVNVESEINSVDAHERFFDLL